MRAVLVVVALGLVACSGGDEEPSQPTADQQVSGMAAFTRAWGEISEAERIALCHELTELGVDAEDIRYLMAREAEMAITEQSAEAIIGFLQRRC